MKRLNKVAIALFAATTLLSGCEFLVNADVDVDARKIGPNGIDPCAELLSSSTDPTLSEAAREALSNAYQDCVVEPPIEPPIGRCDDILTRLPDGVDPDVLFDLCFLAEPQEGDATLPGGPDEPLPPIAIDEVCQIAAEYWACVEPVEPPVCDRVFEATEGMNPDDATQVIGDWDECFPRPEPNPCDELFESGQISEAEFDACLGEPEPCEAMLQSGEMTDDEYQHCVNPEPHPCDDLIAEGNDVDEARYQECLDDPNNGGTEPGDGDNDTPPSDEDPDRANG